jgi:hypothetical protein
MVCSAGKHEYLGRRKGERCRMSDLLDDLPQLNTSSSISINGCSVKLADLCMPLPLNIRDIPCLLKRHIRLRGAVGIFMETQCARGATG